MPAPGDTDVPGGRGSGPAAAADGDERWATPGIQFIPVELVGHAASAADTVPAGEPAIATADGGVDGAGPTFAARVDEGWTERTSLFGEPEA